MQVMTKSLHCIACTSIICWKVVILVNSGARGSLIGSLFILLWSLISYCCCLSIGIHIDYMCDMTQVYQVSRLFSRNRAHILLTLKTDILGYPHLMVVGNKEHKTNFWCLLTSRIELINSPDFNVVKPE